MMHVSVDNQWLFMLCHIGLTTYISHMLRYDSAGRVSSLALSEMYFDLVLGPI